MQWAVDQAYDLWLLCQSKKQQRPVAKQQSWCPPPEGWAKCNTDGAFYGGVNQGATGAVLRDSTGSFVAGKACWYPHGCDALMFEALACRDGVILARQEGVPRLQLETDSQEFVRLWNAGNAQRSFLTPILKEIREISTSFQGFSVVYASRTCNQVAHVLAKQVTEECRLGE